MIPNVAGVLRRQQQQQQEQAAPARGPVTPIGARAAGGGRGRGGGAVPARSVSTAPVRAPRVQRTELPRLAPRPPGFAQAPLTAQQQQQQQQATPFGPRLGGAGAAPAPGQMTEEEEAALFASILETVDEFGMTTEEAYEELQRQEREVRLAKTTPGSVSAQQMIDFFRSAGQDPNAPPDVEVEYPDGGRGPARYSICAQAIAEQWGGFTRRLLDRMENERRRGPGSTAARLGGDLRALSLTAQNEPQFYTLGVTVSTIPPAIANTVLLPVGGPQGAPAGGAAGPFMTLTPPAARGIEQATATASGNSMEALTAVVDQAARIRGRERVDIGELEDELLSAEPSDDPVIRQGQEQINEIINTSVRAVVTPLAEAIANQATAEMQSMLGEFTVGAQPAEATAAAQAQPPLVQVISEQQADALVTANVEAQQQEAASRAVSAAPSPVPTGAAALPSAAGVPSPAQVTAALERAVTQQQQQPVRGRQRRTVAQPVGRPGRRGARTPPIQRLTGAPAAATGFASAPASPFYTLANVIRATGEAPDTEPLNVPTPPVVPATVEGIVQLVDAGVRQTVRDTLERRQDVITAAANTLEQIHEQVQTEAQQAPQLAQTTRTSVANVLASEQVPPDVARAVTSIIEQPGQVNPAAVRNVAEQLYNTQREAAATAARTEAPEQRATARARDRLVKNINDAAATVGAYSQQIADNIRNPLFRQIQALFREAELRGIAISDDLVNIFFNGTDNLAIVAVDGVIDSLNQIAAQEAQGFGGRRTATVTPGSQ